MQRSFRLTLRSPRQELLSVIRDIVGALRLFYLLVLSIPVGILLFVAIGALQSTPFNNSNLLGYMGGAILGVFVLTVGLAAASGRFQWLVGNASNRFFCWTTVGIVSVLALFYSIEKWRGKRMWSEVERDLASQGATPGSWKSPAIPPDQDMAKTPIFLPLTKVEVQLDGTMVAGDQAGYKRLQRIQIPVFATSLRAVASSPDAPWFGGGHFNLERVANSLKSKSDKPLNGALEQMPHLPDAPPETVVLAYINSFGEDLEQIREASRRTNSSLPSNREVDVVMMRLAEVFAWRAAAELKLDQKNEALEDVRCALRLARLEADLHTCIANEGGVFMVTRALQPVYEGLEAHQWSEAQIATLQTDLEQIQPLANFEPVNRYCTWVNMDLINEIIPISALRPAPEWKNVKDEPIVKWIRLIYPKGWSFQDQAALYQLYRQTSSAVELKQQRVSMQVFNRQPPIQTLDPFFTTVILPRARAISGEILQSVIKLHNSVNFARTACALERFRLAEGHNPEKLEDLIPRFIAKAPRDLFGQSLEYGLTSSGNIKLRSGDWTWQYAN